MYANAHQHWNMNMQQHPSQPDILMDGYISHTFQSQSADRHFRSVLKVSMSQLNIYHQGSSGCFFITNNALYSGSPPMILDYFVELRRGSIVPQQLWIPHSQTDQRQHVDDAWLGPPTFFTHQNSSIGVRLVDATAGSLSTLRDAPEPARLGNKSTIHIRMNWPGYSTYDWKRQFQAKDETASKNPITLERLVRHVGRSVDAFIRDASLHQCASPQWRFGLGGLSREDITIIGIVHVSAGSIMPILQIGRLIVDPLLPQQLQIS